MKIAANKARRDGIFTDSDKCPPETTEQTRKTNRHQQNVLVPAFTATWKKSNIHNARFLPKLNSRRFIPVQQIFSSSGGN